VREFITHKSDFYTQSVVLTRVSVIITLIRVSITLVRVEIYVVSVVFTVMRFNITLRVEITLCVWKLHSACRSHTLHILITLVRVEITLFG
jgi:hypothetical protein